MKKTPKVGIVILTYNSEEYIAGCLKNLLKNAYDNFSCVIVDNSSTDQTVKIVKDKYPKLKLIKNKSNLGYAAGNNVGIRHLLKNKNVSYILILNPDTLVSPNLISECVRVLIHGNKIGIVGPIITYARDPDKIWFAGGYLNKLFLYTKHKYMNKYVDSLKRPIFVIARSPKFFGTTRQSQLSTNRLLRGVYGEYIESTRNDTVETDFITGACMMVKREIFEKIGLLPEEYFMYFEDVGFCQKAINAGYSCRLLPKPLVKHYVSASTGNVGSNDLTSFRAYYYARNPFIYIKKNVKGLYKITNIFGQCFIRLPFYGLQILLKGNIKGIFAYLKGLKDGIIYH